MANRNWPNSRIYTGHVMPVLLDCNFTVDSTATTGIAALKGPFVQSVTMPTTSSPAGSPALGRARSFAILGASAITNTGNSVVTGDMGIFPGTSVTGFPPGVVNGVEHFTDSAAANAQIDALAAYTTLAAHASTVIPSALDGQTLTAGYYSFASGAATLAAAGAGTLTFSGSATDIFVVKTASTLTTGAGGTPTITMSGGALASNVYWVVGSSATINSGFTGTFRGTLIAQVSITDTLGGTIDGKLLALTGAVTLSAATTATNFVTASPGTILVKLQDTFNRFYATYNSIISPNSGTALKIDNTALTVNSPYTISTLGNSTAAKWHTMGVPIGVTPAVGVSFIAASDGGSVNTSTSRVMSPATYGSGVATIEMVSNPNATISPDTSASTGQSFGAQFILQCRDYSGAPVAPADGSVISLNFYLSNSSVLIQGE